MTESLVLLASGLTGAVLGAVFFGGLWWTVRRSVNMRQPAPLIAGSLVLRSAFVLAGFYVITLCGAGHGALARAPGSAVLGVALLGFVGARWVTLRATAPQAAARDSESMGARDAH